MTRILQTNIHVHVWHVPHYMLIKLTFTKNKAPQACYHSYTMNERSCSCLSCSTLYTFNNYVYEKHGPSCLLRHVYYKRNFHVLVCHVPRFTIIKLMFTFSKSMAPHACYHTYSTNECSRFTFDMPSSYVYKPYAYIYETIHFTLQWNVIVTWRFLYEGCWQSENLFAVLALLKLRMPTHSALEILRFWNDGWAQWGNLFSSP